MTARRFTFLIGGRLGMAMGHEGGTVSVSIPVSDTATITMSSVAATDVLGLVDALSGAAALAECELTALVAGGKA